MQKVIYFINISSVVLVCAVLLGYLSGNPIPTWLPLVVIVPVFLLGLLAVAAGEMGTAGENDCT